MRRPRNPGFWLVAGREWRWLLRDRAALILIFGVPLFAFVVLSAVFSHPVIRGLGVVVVDDDRSETSRSFVEKVAASPNLNIVDRASDVASAARAIRAGDAIAAVYIPPDFERDLKAARRPQVVAFYNQQLLTAAGIASQGLSDASPRPADSAAEPRGADGRPASARLVAENIVLVNPQKNYAQFLLRALLPMVMHVGHRHRLRAMRWARSSGAAACATWLACAGGNPIVALAGKLAPLFAIFFVHHAVGALDPRRDVRNPVQGRRAMMIVAGSLLIVGYLALGALMQLLMRDLATGLGLTGLIVSPAFGYAGVGFPILGMNAFATDLGRDIAVALVHGGAARTGGARPAGQESARPFAALAALAILFTLLALLRLRAIAGSMTRKPLPAPGRGSAAPRGIGGAFAAEWQRVLAIRGALILMVGAPIIYGVLLPAALSDQILRKVPIAVVDSDLSEISRRIVETLDASGAVRVAVRADTLADARAAVDRGEAFAVVGIPPGTQRDVLKGVTVHLPIYADATYLFVFGRRPTGSRPLSARCHPSSRRAARAPTAVSSRRALRVESCRHPAPADFQPGRRLRELYRAGRLCAHSAADAPDRRRDADHHCDDAGGRGDIRERARPRPRPPHHLPACARAVLHRPAALLRLLGARQSAADICARLAVPSRDELHGPSRRRVVQTSGDADAGLSRHQPAAVLLDRLCVAARGDPRPRACGGADLPG